MRFLLPLLFVFCVGTFGCQKSAPAKPVVRSEPEVQSIKLQIKTASEMLSFDVEVANSFKERQKGLMHRDSLDDDKGMIFVFEKSRVQSFWMKNTRIPLDMFFVDKDKKVVGIVENAEPFTLTSRSCGKPSLYVLELTGGAARRLGIAVGDTLTFADIETEK